MNIVVGAGLAGLVCAKTLAEAGQPVKLLESTGRPGGRLRTVVRDGFRFDRGFQVLLDSYPSVKRHLDLDALDVRSFQSGALLWDEGDFCRVMHPLRHTNWMLSDMMCPAFPLQDGIQIAKFAAGLFLKNDGAILKGCSSDRDVSTREFLRGAGVSDAVVRQFFEPFFGGVFLDDSLETSAALFSYYFKKFLTGRALIPAKGIEEVPKQLASKLPDGVLKLHEAVKGLSIRDGRVVSVGTSRGESLEATNVVLATDGPVAQELLGVKRPGVRASRGVATVYFETAGPLYTGGLLVLPAGRGRVVRHCVQLTNIAPEFAPPGRCLLSATLLDFEKLDDAEACDRAKAELAMIFTDTKIPIKPLAVMRVPFAVYSQPPGFAAKIPSPPLPDNVFLAGDQAGPSSIEQAMASGEAAAQSIIANTP